MSEASKGWVCPVCGRGIAPAEKFCSHGNSFDPYKTPRIAQLDPGFGGYKATVSVQAPLKLRPQSKYQDSAELEWFVRLTQKLNVQRYLEIGSRWGDSLYAVMMNRDLSLVGFAGVIDISESPEKLKRLVETLDEIEKTGAAVAHFSGSSRNPAALIFAKEHELYDLIFIDGDHTYEGAMADWYTYHQLAPVIVFHDIAAPDTWVSDGKLNGVQKFWRELTAKDTPMCSHGFKKVEEFVTPGSNMGYGVIYR